ncbi:di-trans,poly-cis-decaprenylcistransferase [gamma proteobacterium HTCC5015]|nr:di-trans,poly-cis-decaprenylcistransferase [gamma proteobacterium HTCC5015]
MSESEATDNKPQHIAIIMDGNGRWAKRRGLPRTAGHKAGVKAARAVIEACEPHRIQHLTLFAFSSENWKRPEDEVSSLMQIFVSTLSKELKSLKERNVRLRFIGDKSAFDEKLRDHMASAETQTADNTGLQLNIAVNYGGRWDMTQAAYALAKKVQNGIIEPRHITEQTVAQHLSLSELPDPDLMIRTGGEHRISNFLLWQLAYAEIYFSPDWWPDFGAQQINDAVAWFGARERRFGQTSEQLEKQHA